jgi:hypothetical protein
MSDPLPDAGADADPDAASVTATTQPRLASEVFLFLHAGGIPIDGISHQLSALGCFGKPDAWFDLDGRMWARMQGEGANGFAAYLESLIDRTEASGGILSALVDCQDLLWLEQRPIFQDQLRQRLRVARLTFLDPALQACRRWRAAEIQRGRHRDEHAAPGFAEFSRELIGIEEAEHRGDVFCRRHGLPMVKLWVEDLARPGVPALRALLARWSLPSPAETGFLPIDPPARAEQEITAALRAEASRRHWSHALLPRVM